MIKKYNVLVMLSNGTEETITNCEINKGDKAFRIDVKGTHAHIETNKVDKSFCIDVEGVYLRIGKMYSFYPMHMIEKIRFDEVNG